MGDGPKKTGCCVLSHRPCCRQLVEAAKKYNAQVHSLEERLRGFVGAASRLAQMGESMAEAADKVCYSSGLADQAGKSIDCDPMKQVVEGFKERCERVRSDIAVLDEEIKTLLSHVEERNKAGAHYEKERSKAEKLEGKHDAVRMVYLEEFVLLICLLSKESVLCSLRGRQGVRRVSAGARQNAERAAGLEEQRRIALRAHSQ